METTCIIVDDEPLALEILETYLEKIPEIKLLGAFSNGIEALHFLKNHQVDLLLLDIEMPELTGIQLMKVLSDPPKVIFTTAYDQYAIKSYELEAVDYLLKPVQFSRFLQAIEKAQKQISREKPASFSQMSPEASYLFIKTEHRIQRIEKADILYIEGMKNYLRIVTNHNKYMTILSFKKAQMLLNEDRFIRVHKSFLIAINKIDCIEHGRILIGERRIPISETYKTAVQARINGCYL